MVHKHVPATADVAMETDQFWTAEQRVQNQNDENYIQHLYERQRRRNQQHRWNQRRRMWEAWERLEMIKNDMDICRRSTEGRKIDVKKMPKPKRRYSPSPRPGPAKCPKALRLLRHQLAWTQTRLQVLLQVQS